MRQKQAKPPKVKEGEKQMSVLPFLNCPQDCYNTESPEARNERAMPRLAEAHTVLTFPIPCPSPGGSSLGVWTPRALGPREGGGPAFSPRAPACAEPSLPCSICMETGFASGVVITESAFLRSEPRLVSDFNHEPSGQRFAPGFAVPARAAMNSKLPLLWGQPGNVPFRHLSPPEGRASLSARTTCLSPPGCTTCEPERDPTYVHHQEALNQSRDWDRMLHRPHHKQFWFWDRSAFAHGRMFLCNGLFLLFMGKLALGFKHKEVLLRRKLSFVSNDCKN